MRIIKLSIFPVPVRLHSGYSKLIFVIISPFFAIFKNVAHILGSYSNYAQCSRISQNISKRFGAVAVRLRYFSIYLGSVLYDTNMTECAFTCYSVVSFVASWYFVDFVTTGHEMQTWSFCTFKAKRGILQRDIALDLYLLVHFMSIATAASAMKASHFITVKAFLPLWFRSFFLCY